MRKLTPFSSLTVRGQARRLRNLAVVALQQYDLKVKRMNLLAHAVNTLFRLDIEGGDTLVLRINLPNARSQAEICAEMNWLSALAGVEGLYAPLPHAARDGELVVTAGAQGVPEDRHCVIFSWLPGQLLFHRATNKNLEKLGECMARLHTHAESFDFPGSFALKTGETVFGVSGEQILFGEDVSIQVNKDQQRLFEAGAHKVQSFLSQLYAQEKHLIPVHGDLHQGNVKVYRNRMYIFDFDDSFLGHPVQDIAISYYYMKYSPQAEQFREAFRTGYTHLRTWPDFTDDQIRLLSAGRAMDVLNHVLQSDNPKLMEIAPRYIEFTTAFLQVVL